MAVFPAPASTMFELQRTALEQGQRALETGVAFQTNTSRFLVDGMERQKRTQRRVLALQHVAVHRICNRIDERTPGPNPATDAVREVVDEQYSRLYELNDETFDRYVADLEVGVDAYDDVSAEYLDALSEQVALLVRATETAEAESLDAAEGLAAQLDALADLYEQFGRGPKRTR